MGRKGNLLGERQDTWEREENKKKQKPNLPKLKEKPKLPDRAIDQEEKQKLNRQVMDFMQSADAPLGGTGAAYAREAQKQDRLTKDAENTLKAVQKEQAKAKEKREAWKPKMERPAVENAEAAEKKYAEMERKPEESSLEQRRAVKAEAEYWRNQEQAEKDAGTMQADMAELDSWPEKDRAALKTYIIERGREADPTAGYSFGTARANATELFNKYGAKKIKELAESYGRWENARNAREIAAAGASAAESGGFADTLGTIGANIASVGANLAGAMTGTAGYLSEMTRRTGRYATLDANNEGNVFGTWAGAVRQKTAENLEQGATGKVGSTIYQGAMSAADSLTRALIAGPAGAATLAASDSFARNVSQASGQGASPMQAVTLGIANAGIEYLTEKIPLDNLFKAAKGGTKGAAAFIKGILKQGGLEAATEELSLLGSIAAEAAILGDKDSTRQRIGELVANGASYRDAKEQVNRELWAEAANTFAVSFAAGGLGAGAGQLLGNLAGAQPETAQPVPQAVTAEKTPQQRLMETMAPIAQQAPKAVQTEQEARAAEAAKAMLAGILPTQEQNAASDITNEAESNPAGEVPETGSLATPINSASENVISQNGRKVNVNTEVYGSPQQTDTFGQSAQEEQREESGYGANTVGGAQSRFDHKVNQSRVYENSLKNAVGPGVQKIRDAVKEAVPEISSYDVVTESESLYNAVLRTRTPEEIDFEYDDLTSRDGWTNEDNDTAFILMNNFRKKGDIDRLVAIAKKQREEATKSGQLIQSFAKYSRTPTKAAADAVFAMDDLKPEDVPRHFYRKTDFNTWKKSVEESVLEIANEIDAIPEGDANGMQNIVRQLAAFRKTTAWFGMQSRLTKIADRFVQKLDYNAAKEIAASQLSMIPGDFRKRSMGQVIKTIRIQNMLSSLTTVNRNLAGNTTMGLMDAVSDSTSGVAMDMLMAKFTGKRTVGNDVKFTKAYLNAAKDAASMAALCAELDIPMEYQAKYSTGTRNYSAAAGPVSRFMSAYEKYLEYALSVTDKFFEGGASGAVSESLRSLGEKSGLSEKEIDQLAQRVGTRRTFKEGRQLSKASTALKDALNYIGTDNFGAGDLFVPFAGVPGDVAQVGVDYSGGGLIEGFTEIAKIIRDAKAGKDIDVYRQRKAATDFARGVTGSGMIALFTALTAAGVVGVHNDEDRDKRALEQSMDLSGAQLNLDAAIRAVSGGETKWRENDLLIGIDFLDPINTQLFIGYLAAQEDSVEDIIKSYPQNAFRGILSSVLDMPMMQTFADLADIGSSLAEVAEDGDYSGVVDASGQMAGNTLSGFIPSWLRQTAQYIDPYYRDTSGVNAAESAMNKLKAAIPFASRTLPKKYTGLGDEQLRYTDKLAGFFNIFVNPGSAERVQGNEIAEYLGELSRKTGNDAIFPEYAAPKSVTVDGEKIMISGQEMTERYQRAYGETVAALYGDLIGNEGFQNLPEELQLEALRKAKSNAAATAKNAIVPYYQDVPEGTPNEQTAEILRKIVNSEFTGAFENEDRDGLKKAWEIYDGLTESQKTSLMENADTRTREFLDRMNSGGASLEAAVNFAISDKEISARLDAGFSDVDAEEMGNAYEIFKSMDRSDRTQFLEDASGRVRSYLLSREAGISDVKYLELYQKYREVDGAQLTQAEKAAQWALYLDKQNRAGLITDKQRSILKDKLVYMQQFRAETEKYDQMVEVGVKAETAFDVGKLLEGIKPQEGYKTVRAVQKYEAIANSKYSDKEIDLVMKIYMPDYDPTDKSPDRTELKYDTVRGLGYSPEEYVDIYRAYSEADKKAEQIAKIQALGYSYQEAYRLYTIYYGSYFKNRRSN